MWSPKVFAQVIVEKIEAEKIFQPLQPMADTLSSLTEKMRGNILPDERTQLIQRYNAYLNVYRHQLTNTMHQNKNAAAILLFSYFRVDNNLPELRKNAALLPKEEWSNAYGKYLQDEIAAIENIHVGKEAPVFEMADANGKPHSISTGKNTLLLFWASWCAPCRAENKNLKEIYAQYASKNFTVVSVSLDNVKSHWQLALQQDQLPWLNLWDAQAWDNVAARKYAIHQLPQNILIDPNGKILGLNWSVKQLAAYLEKL